MKDWKVKADINAIVGIIDKYHKILIALSLALRDLLTYTELPPEVKNRLINRTVFSLKSLRDIKKLLDFLKEVEDERTG